MRSSAAALHASSTDARFSCISEKSWLLLFILCEMSFWSKTWEEERLYVFLLGFAGLTQLKQTIWYRIQQVLEQTAVLSFASFFSALCQGFETLFFFLFSVFPPIVIVLCCRALNRTKTTVTGLPPLKVNVLKKTLLPKMLYCWMSQIMIYCRSYVLWNHSQEMCVNTSSM